VIIYVLSWYVAGIYDYSDFVFMLPAVLRPPTRLADCFGSLTQGLMVWESFGPYPLSLPQGVSWDLFQHFKGRARRQGA
jgi:hypothetical protein